MFFKSYLCIICSQVYSFSKNEAKMVSTSDNCHLQLHMGVGRNIRQSQTTRMDYWHMGR